MLDRNRSEKVESKMKFKTNHNEKEKLWEVTLNSSNILEYVYGAVEDTNPSFRLVKTISGHTVSIYRPWDHPWHSGMFFSWKYLNGSNFWEAKYHGEENIVVTDSFTPNTDEIGFQQSLSYITYDGETLIKENRTVQVEEAPNGYLVHWQGSFTPASNSVTLSSSENAKETPWGGYAGLSFRLNRNYLGPVITTDLGIHTAEEAFARPFKWCDYSGKLDGYIEENWAGICIMDQPLNLRYPSPKLTYDYKDMQFLSAAILFNNPYVLNKGETLDLNYTFYVHDGKAQKKELSQIWEKLKR